MVGIEMESDCPSQNSDNKMPILDMKVWDDCDNRIVYKHYEKTVSSKQILSARSAQSSACKRSVHVQEMVRRILNTSTRLEWDEYVAPTLSEYMKRMALAGYNENYRKTTLIHAISIFDHMKEEQQLGTRPLHRPRNWQEEERRKKKKRKRNNWSSK